MYPFEFVLRVYNMLERDLKTSWWDEFCEVKKLLSWDANILRSRAILSILSSDSIFSVHSWLGFKWSYLCFRAVQAYCCTMMVFGFNLRNFDFSATCLVVAKNAKLFALPTLGCRVITWFFNPGLTFHSSKFKLSNLTHKYIYLACGGQTPRLFYKALVKVLWPNWSQNLPIFREISKKSLIFFSNLNKSYLNQT